MRFIFSCVFLILFITLHVYSNDIKSYDAELIKYFSHEDRREAALIFGKPDSGFAGCFPMCFTISSDDKIYVHDTCRSRIAIFNLNMEYIGEIKKKRLFEADSMKVNNDKVYLMKSGSVLTCMDFNSNVEYRTYGAIISEIIFSKNNYFPVSDSLFFYDNENSLRLINETGKIVESTVAHQKLMQVQTINNETKDNSVNNEIVKYSENNNLLIINNRLFHPSYEEHKKYFTLKNRIASIKAENFPAESLESLHISMDTFIGYDNDSNSYWKGFKFITLQNEKQKSIEIIVILDPYGNLLDYFKKDSKYYDINITSSGNIYLMAVGVQVNGVAFYKITRRW